MCSLREWACSYGLQRSVCPFLIATCLAAFPGGPHLRVNVPAQFFARSGFQPHLLVGSQRHQFGDGFFYLRFFFGHLHQFLLAAGIQKLQPAPEFRPFATISRELGQLQQVDLQQIRKPGYCYGYLNMDEKTIFIG